MDGESTEVAEVEDTGAPEAPDFGEAISSLEANLKAEIAALKPAEPEFDPVSSLVGNDVWEDSSDDEEEPAYQPQTSAELERLQAIEDYIIGKETEERTGQLSALADKYADFKDRIPEITKVLDQISSDEGVRTNPQLVERIYKSLKAEADADAETPAEEARGRGASLETDATAGAPSEEDPDAEFKRRFAQSTETSVFG